MHEYSRPLGDTVRAARLQQGLTQKQISDRLNVDERTIISIENYKSNTTMEILFPLLRLLKIDARQIFNPELGRESQAHYQLRLLIDNCSVAEATTLVSVCESVLSALRNPNATTIEHEKSLPSP